MGKKSKPAPPPTPDYAGAARAQGEANIKAAQTQAELARFNQQTPFGSLEWMQDPSDPNRWTSSITLSPEQQQLVNLQQQGQIGMGDAALGMLPGLTQQLQQPFDTSSLPPWMTSLDMSGVPQIQGSLDFSNLPGVTSADGFAPQLAEVRDTLYRQQTGMLDPQFAQQEEATRARLAAQGLMPGSEAFDREMDNFYRTRQSAYGDARDRAILAGGQEQSRLNADSLAARNAILAEILTGGTFANQAQQQAFGQQFQTESANAALANAVRQGALAEGLTLRQLPLQEFLTMFGGVQPQLPDFQGTQGVQGIESAPIFAGAQAQDQHAQNLYEQQMAARNNAISGFYGALGAIPGMFSFGA